MRYKMRRLLVAVLLAVLLGGCGAPAVPAPAPAYRYPTQALIPYDGQLAPRTEVPGMTFVAERGFTAMYADLETGNIAVVDRRTQAVFYSMPPTTDEDEIAYGSYKARLRSPLLTTDVVETDGVLKTKSAYESAYEKGGVEARPTADGVQVWFKFMDEQYAIPVEYTLCEDGFRVRVLCDKIVEQGEARLFGVSLLPFFGAQPGTADGFLLVPDGSGALIRFDSQKASYAAYTAPLYGDDHLTVDDYQANVQETCLLPMIGLQSAQGGFLAIADNGAAYGSVYADVDGRLTGHNNVYFSFDLRKRQTALIGNAQSFNAKTVSVYEEGPIAVGEVSVRYVLLDGDTDSGLSKMAEAGRAYVRQELGELPLSGLHNPLYIAALGGYRKTTSVLGVRTDVTVPATPFTAAAEMEERLQGLGVTGAAYLYSGYDRAALRGEARSRVRLDGAVGSDGDLAALLEILGKDRLFLRVDPVVCRRDSAAARAQTDATRDISRNRYRWVTYKRNTFHPDTESGDAYLLKSPLAAQLLRQTAADLRARFPAAGLLAERYGSLLYEDFSQGGSRRAQAAQTVADTLRVLAGERALITENAVFPAALFSSAIVDAPAASSGYDILDGSVPFYQMVMGGSRQLVSRPINAQGDSEAAFLACVRAGMVPQYELAMTDAGVLKASGLDSFYAAAFADWGETVAAAYARYRPIFAQTDGVSLTDYRFLTDDVTETVYANGVRLWVNTGSEPYAADGRRVEPNGFLLWEQN